MSSKLGLVRTLKINHQSKTTNKRRKLKSVTNWTNLCFLKLVSSVCCFNTASHMVAALNPLYSALCFLKCGNKWVVLCKALLPPCNLHTLNVAAGLCLTPNSKNRHTANIVCLQFWRWAETLDFNTSWLFERRNSYWFWTLIRYMCVCVYARMRTASRPSL